MDNSESMLAASQCGVRTPLSPLAQATIEKHLPGLSGRRFLQRTQTPAVIQKVDASVITDICICEDLPEVEIFSLLEENIPKYKIRADKLTEFGGYENQDWFITAPALSIPTEGLGLNKDQLRETLNYFLLCGNRVSQMTQAYDDIEAVQRLLVEKEKDLELTVQIGKELLTQNNRLESRITELEADLKSSNEDRSQLLHDLHQKNELIAVLTNDVDDSSENDTPTLSKSITLDLLQRKISSLQDENKSLKQEASQLVQQTDEVEEQERRLMEDITTQLNSTNNQFEGISLELERYKEENRLQHEQIINLTSRLSEAEMRLHQITSENDEQISILSITKENQNMLATELAEFKSRYQEVLALLQETQEQLRKERKKTQPHARSSFIPNLGIPQHDSLHSELMESSLYSDNSIDSGILADKICGSGQAGLASYKRVFETVNCATKNGQYTDGMSQLGVMSLSSSSQPRMSALPYIPTQMNNNGTLSHRPSSVYSTSTFPTSDLSSMGAKSMSLESLASQSDDGFPAPTGVPGVPGAKDLEAALKRLTPAEVLIRRTMLSNAPAGTYSYDDNQALPFGIRTPDSIMSTGSHNSQHLSNQWRLPQKLQIVKPLEGSQTLHQWSCLAQPTLNGLLEERRGVTIRGGRDLEDLGYQMYSLSDVEEDYDDHPGKQFQLSSCVYTFTNSMVMHPDDGTMIDLSFGLSQSQLSSRLASVSTSRQPSCPPTPRSGLSRRNSCSTFSVNMGLASMLNERGIKAVTPSALNSPAGPNYSPTVTPCNSPEGSPTRSISPEPLFGIFSSGADLIRRKLIGEGDRPTRSQNKQQKIMLSRLEKRALRSLRLLEKVESAGLQNIITTQPNSMNQLVSGIASRSASPMAKLTNQKKINTNNNSNINDIEYINTDIRNILSTDVSDSIKNSTNDLHDCDTLSSTSSIDSGIAKTTVCTQNNLTETNKCNLDIDDTTNDIRIRQMQRQKSRRNLKNGIGSQRPDLGTVGKRIRPDLGKVINKSDKEIISKQQNTDQDDRTHQTMTQSFVGTISSLFFGRKGGWL